MNVQAKIQKWGNSAAIRLPATALAAAGMHLDSEVDIQADKGRLVIQLPEKTNEELLDKLLAEVPDAKEVLTAMQNSLTKAISLTENTAAGVEKLCDELNRNKGAD